jgi:hypothetical protein
MAEVSNLVGQLDLVHHHEDTLFDISFQVKDSAGNAFSLADYEGEFRIMNNETERTELLKLSTTDETPKLTFESNTFKIEELISLSSRGKFYFELRILHKTIPGKKYVIWFGTWHNV